MGRRVEPEQRTELLLERYMLHSCIGSHHIHLGLAMNVHQSGRLHNSISQNCDRILPPMDNKEGLVEPWERSHHIHDSTGKPNSLDSTSGNHNPELEEHSSHCMLDNQSFEWVAGVLDVSHCLSNEASR